MEIFDRDDEHAQIRDFLDGNLSTGASGLMYLCGHPGTGKTSSLNYVMKLMQEEGASFQPLLFNAMTFSDVRTFGIKLYQSLHEEFFGEFPKRRYERNQIDDEDLANLIERLLQKITKQGKPHRIIVIDEVDCFSR